MNTEMNTEDSLTLILLGFTGLFVLVWVLWLSSHTPEEMHEFCQSKGHGEATDFKRNKFYSYQIECDGDSIYEAISIEECVESDKWGDCTEGRWVYE